jgi:hypothetical protein
MHAPWGPQRQIGTPISLVARKWITSSAPPRILGTFLVYIPDGEASFHQRSRSITQHKTEQPQTLLSNRYFSFVNHLIDNTNTQNAPSRRIYHGPVYGPCTGCTSASDNTHTRPEHHNIALRRRSCNKLGQRTTHFLVADCSHRSRQDKAPS